MPAAGAAVVWIVLLIGDSETALISSWLLLLAIALAAHSLLIRLHYSPTQMAVTIGPWRRAVDLSQLESISWKKTGGGRSRGTIMLRDRSGHTVPIYLGRFTAREEWGPLLVHAAAQAHAPVDAHSRSYLEGRMDERAFVH